ncbi:hypothetical protein SCUP234_05031 [Seiridium cupressi]
MFRQLREAKLKKNRQPPPSSVQETSRFLVTFCVDFINSLGWEDFSLFKSTYWEEGIWSKPVQSIYADKINSTATEEKILFESFKKKMKKKDESEKKKTQDTKEEPEPVHTKKETKTEELQTIVPVAPGAIGALKAADLLDEVKDILDELTILKALVTQQESVWEDLMGQDSEPENARRPIYVLRDIEEMISKCGLEQNGINIDEANESDRLGANVLSQDAVVLPHVTFRLERHGIPA